MGAQPSEVKPHLVLKNQQKLPKQRQSQVQKHTKYLGMGSSVSLTGEVTGLREGGRGQAGLPRSLLYARIENKELTGFSNMPTTWLER